MPAPAVEAPGPIRVGVREPSQRPGPNSGALLGGSFATDGEPTEPPSKVGVPPDHLLEYALILGVQNCSR